MTTRLGLTLPTVPSGRLLALGVHPLPDFSGHFALAPAPLPALRVGEMLCADDIGLLQVQAVGHWPHPEASRPVIYLRALTHVEEGPYDLTVTRRGFSLAFVTLSDKGAAGLRTDASGPLIEEVVREKLTVSFARGFLLPDEGRALKALLVQLALCEGYDLILTTGGTGLTSRDVSPEATLAVIERRLPGFERAMTMGSLVKTPHALLSRAVAGTLGTSLVVNLPGSPKGVRENLELILPAIPHALEKLKDDPGECAR
jgi:molybdenum cofactor synthesis domain-containing protein